MSHLISMRPSAASISTFNWYLKIYGRSKINISGTSCSCSSKSYCTSGNDTDDILINFVNRNPRNMEMLRLARKPIGHCLDTPTINFWYRLGFERTNKFLNAFVEHHSGRKVIEVSTREVAFRNQLYSMQDVSAAMNLGTILARRCLQAGIIEVHTELFRQIENSKRISAFVNAVKEGGLLLEEPPQLREKEFYFGVKQFPTCPWDVTEEDVDKLDSDPPQPLPDRYFASFKPR